MQFYTDAERECDPYAIPDAETFYIEEHDPEYTDLADDDGEPLPEGWYWWSCFPGCLPDGPPNGPFATEEEAIADARERHADDDF